jgi:hypothetical protein
MKNKNLEKFRRILSRLTPVERSLPIVKVDDKFLSWDEIHKGLVRGDKTAKIAFNKLKKMGLV